MSAAIKCDRNGCTGSSLLSVLEQGYPVAGKPATCGLCGKIFPRSNATLADFQLSEGAHPVERVSRASAHAQVQGRSTSDDPGRRNLTVSQHEDTNDESGFCATSGSTSSAVLAGLGCTKFLPGGQKSSIRSCRKDTHLAEQMSFTHPVIHASPAHFVTSQPDVLTGVELVSRATYISKPTREQSGKRNASLWHNPKSARQAAGQTLRSQATRID